MKPETISLLCRPGSHEPLRLVSMPGADGLFQEELVCARTNERFIIRDGIPVLVDDVKVTGFNKRYQGIYNRVAGLYDMGIKLAGYLLGKSEKDFRREYLSELSLKEGDRILDVSVGTGGSLHFLPSNIIFYGLDLSWGMLKKCQKNLKRWKLDAELVLGNAEDIPFQDESFDAVLHVGGINAFNDRGKAITEMIRVAKPGTKIIIVDETLKLMNSVKWIPAVKKWLHEYRDRFAAPTDLVPRDMKEVQVKELARGNLYCLTFIKPWQDLIATTK